MKIFILALLSFTQLVLAQVPVTITADYISGRNENVNYTRNPSCEKNTLNISASGGTLIRTTALPIDHSSHCTWVPSALAQTLTFDTNTMPTGMVTSNCEVRFTYVASDSYAKAYLIDPTGNKISAEITLTGDGTAPKTETLYTPCGGTYPNKSKAPRLRIETTNAAAGTFRIAKVESSKLRSIGVVPAVTDWINLGAISVTGSTTNPVYGSVAYNYMQYRIVGANVELEWHFKQTTAGTEGSGTYLIPIPTEIRSYLTGYTSDTSITNPIRTGEMLGYMTVQRDGGYNFVGTVSLYDSTRFKVVMNGDVDRSSSVAWNSTNAASFVMVSSIKMHLSWKARGLSANRSAAAANQTDWGWTNFGENTITATTTNPTKGSTRTVDKFWGKRSGENLHVRIEYRQTNAGSSGAGDYLWAIPAATGCVIDTSKVAPYSGTATSENLNIDGSAQVGTGSAAGFGGVVVYDSTRVRIATTSTAEASFKFQGSSFYPFSAAMSTVASFKVPCVGWVENQRAPTLIGSVSNDDSRAFRTEYFTFSGAASETTTCTTSPCTLRRNSSGISSITRVSQGVYTINFPVGTWSAPPVCMFLGGTFANAWAVQKSATTLPTTTTYTFIQSIGVSPWAGDSWGDGFCFGPR